MAANSSDFAALLPGTQHARAWWRAPGTSSGLAWAIARAADAHRGALLVVAADNHQAHQLETDLRSLADAATQAAILPFPDWEVLPYDSFSPHPDIVSQRLATLSRLPIQKRAVVIVPVQTLLQRLAPVAHVAGGSFHYQTGHRLDLDAEKRRLEAAGYHHVPQVMDPGDFAVRGGLLDVYPMGAHAPYRVELFDDEIDTIRLFDTETQRSAEKVDKVELLPGREVPMDEAARQRAMQALREDFAIDTRRSALYQDLKNALAPAGIEAWLPLFFEGRKTATLFDYLPENTLPVLCEGIFEATEKFSRQTAERFDARRHDSERPLLAPEALYLTEQQLRERINQYRCVEVCGSTHPRYQDAKPLGVQPVPALPLSGHQGEPAAELKTFLRSYPGSVVIAAESAGRREALREVLAATELHPESVSDALRQTQLPAFSITVAALDDGFATEAPQRAVLTERQLYPERALQPRRRKRAGREPEAIIRDLGELSEGAPIVHEDHGVGRYRGLVVLEAGGERGEFLDIEYAKGDRLYVPVAQLHLVNRYSGASPETAPLHSLGGEQWTKAKKKAAEKVRDVAAELLEIQAKRQARAGIAIDVDRAMYEPFAAGFAFEETPDQHAAIEAVIRDLAASQPMDRVVCGDVGFGKTEVAVRAAFVAATGGKQVAVLVPTTLLAEQHYRTLRDRFADWPLKVEVLSRFKSGKDIQVALAKVAAGEIDVIVGTHKLLQPDVKFRDLGLVIVDEEQRFGVRQKEALKALRANVHLLTLTATPIPRTLNMAMAGLRDLSIIATPPANRLAVQTFVNVWDNALLREAFQRELTRGGQLYFLHNDVESIGRMQRELAELVPEARIGIAHGQMPERELEQVMLDFHRQRFNVLLASTIIESGIDIPNANTIIINRADKFGLAQLHQLRGRVGRSHHRAYAYLVIPDRKSITEDARKRLDAIASMDELGAGFTLATHDLEIRGAGELLGEEQSGQMAAVGFSLYTELLERAVKSIKQGKLPDVDGNDARGAEIELHVAALIPDDYLPDVHTRLTLYKRISSAPNADALREMQVEMIDRFGLLPVSAQNLFAITALKQEASALGIRKIDLGEKSGRIHFEKTPNIDPMAVIRLIQGQPQHYQMDGPDKLRLTNFDLPDADARIKTVRGLLMLLKAGS
ncbi:transcription-repair coupling factor [Lysobacteraceae bacterium NML120232]|nr:transcription-repair coupling factor [Xanthomonadaceae bacterium NML120232]